MNSSTPQRPSHDRRAAPPCIARTFLALACAVQLAAADGPKIDREALVTRHNPTFSAADPLDALTLGNGAFAFTVDATGLQSFPEDYEAGLPLTILSDWGWHSFPNAQGHQIEDTYQDFDTYGRPVPYPYLQHTEAGQWLRGNPHRLGLGQVGLEFDLANGETASLSDLDATEQRLDLWTGTLTSRFQIEGQEVRVTTACHPELDLMAVTLESSLLAENRLRVRLRFPYGTSDWGINPNNWSQPERHRTEVETHRDRIQLARTVDATRYFVEIAAEQAAAFEETDAHHFSLSPDPAGGNSFSFSVAFSQEEDLDTPLPRVANTQLASQNAWRAFWTNGGAIDLSQSSDPRAHELERRIVLSQYLTAIQCRGTIPAQETGLTFNSWYGKPHLEMTWWHSVHFALWNRVETLQQLLPWYKRILPKAREIAQTQGYAGARWPKNVDADGNQVPSTIAPLLVWQQPHPIYFAELCYRQDPSPATLGAYRDIVFETAAFMASYPHRDDETGRYDLGPPLIPAQESYDPKATKNPPFELAYWRWGLETAQQWRERLGLERHPDWDRALANLAPYPHYNDMYATAEAVWNTVDHPTVLAAYGMIPGTDIDPQRMRRTLETVMDTWPWNHTWGWDYPMIAMTAARLGEPEIAIEALLLDVTKNTYLPNGHNFQEFGRLRIYLPGNGGLLAAVAMMAAGWDGAPEQPAPGFPQDGAWTVQWEDLHPMP